MASDAAPSATDPSLVAAAHATAASPSATASSSNAVAVASSSSSSSPRQSAARSSPAPLSHKRPREDSPASPSPPSAAARFQRDYSPTKIARLGLTAQLSPPFQLTGAAAVAEERRRKQDEQRRNPPGVSENPNHKALSELMSGATMTVSRPQDAPPAMDEMALAAEATKALGPVTIPQPNVSDARTDISPPHSASSPGGAADSHALMNSPGRMDVDQRSDRLDYASQPEAHMGDKTPTSLSYPGILSPNPAAPPAPVPPPRPASLPHGAEHAPGSSKKHKCPYCDTEFTRHHNLKSHLLTHSQEKPYLCKDCGLRFRRLHDLKRHGKLHTGEKNHECPKCGRKFARGDALARHSKGAGGCAGRRASMGSYGEHGDFDGMPRNDGDDSMVGISYDENGDVDMVDEERRRQSLPAAKNHHGAASDGLMPNSRTYPPAGAAARGGAPNILYPPNNSTAAAPAAIANSLSGITESPKPLSPAMHDQPRQRSPGLASQFQQQQQQQQYGRRQSERDSHPMQPLPPPHSTINPLVHVIRLHQPTNGLQGQQQHPAPPLPPPPPPPQAGSLPLSNNHANPSNASNHAKNATAATTTSHSHTNSGDASVNMFAQADQGVWAYMQQLEDKVKEMSERLLSIESLSNAREARLSSVESTLAQRDAKISSMEVELVGLRKELVEKS